MTRKTIVILVLALLFLLGCGDSKSPANATGGVYPEGAIVKLEWETEGGGDMFFTITRHDGEFQITVKRYASIDVEEAFVLTDPESEVYGILSDIFNKDLNLYHYTHTPAGETGSWTTLTIEFEGAVEISIGDMKIWDNELAVLADYIENSMEQALVPR